MKALRTFTPTRAARKPSGRRTAPVARPMPSRQSPAHFTFGSGGGGGFGLVPNGALMFAGGGGGRVAVAGTAAAFALGTPSSGAHLMRSATPITDRQIEIMTATLCEAIADRKFAHGRADEEIPALIGAMAKQVRRLNEAVAVPAEPEARMAIDRFGRPVPIESAADDARPPLPATAPVKRECGPQAGFVITRDWKLLDLSSSMAGRRLLAVVLFGAEDFAAVERVMRARIVPTQGDPALRDCLRDAVRKCRGNCHPPDARP